MIEIKTRSKTRDIKIRDAALVAPKELSRLMKRQTKAGMTCGKPDQVNSTPENAVVNDVLQGAQTNIQGRTSFVIRETYRGGKMLVQRQLKKRITAKQADFPGRGGQPVYRNGRNKPSQTIRARAQSVRKMQLEMVRQKLTKPIGNVRKKASRLAAVAVKLGMAAKQAIVALIGGAGSMLVPVLIICAAGAVIATPFGIFYSEQDDDSMSLPVAVAQLNQDFANRISQIQAENPADRVAFQCIPSGASEPCITNWAQVLAVFACKTAGAEADATDVAMIDEKRFGLLKQVLWDMNSVSNKVESAAATTEQGSVRERVLHITITSKIHTEMPEYYGFSKAQAQALEEIMKPEYAQMLGRACRNIRRRR